MPLAIRQSGIRETRILNVDWLKTTVRRQSGRVDGIASRIRYSDSKGKLGLSPCGARGSNPLSALHPQCNPTFSKIRSVGRFGSKIRSVRSVRSGGSRPKTAPAGAPPAHWIRIVLPDNGIGQKIWGYEFKYTDSDSDSDSEWHRKNLKKKNK